MDDIRLVVDKSSVEDRLRFIVRLASNQYRDPQLALDAIRHHAEMALLKLDIAKRPSPQQQEMK